MAPFSFCVVQRLQKRRESTYRHDEAQAAERSVGSGHVDNSVLGAERQRVRHSRALNPSHAVSSGGSHGLTPSISEEGACNIFIGFGGVMAAGSGQRSAVQVGAVSDGQGGTVIRFSYGQAGNEVPGTSTAVAQCLAEIRLHLAAGSDDRTVKAVALVYRAFDEIADAERMMGAITHQLGDALAVTSVPVALIARLRELMEIASNARRRQRGVPLPVLDLLGQAETGLQEASAMESANERFAMAHLAALRTAAAVLAARGRPSGETGERRRRRIRSAWEVLPEVVPELTEWSVRFAKGAPTRARAEAGIKGAASMREAEDLIRDASMFLRLSQRILLSDSRQQGELRLPGPDFELRPIADERAALENRRRDVPLSHTPPGPPLGDDDDEWDE